MEFPFIKLDTPPIFEEDDYSQSANSLFHFMKKSSFLYMALSKRALIPRYCRENIGYLNIDLNDVKFDELAVLQKCFCDIPLHNISSKFKISHESETRWSNDHTELYGKFAIAFSKQWGEQNHLQPIQYINADSFYCENLRKYIINCLQSEIVSNECVNDVLLRLSLIKPLRGEMKRSINNEVVIKTKNFHDEQEWRYIPAPEVIEKLNTINNYTITPIIANHELLQEHSFGQDFVNEQSAIIENESNNAAWLEFQYDDIRYIIVPDIQSRIECISFILSLPDTQFNKINNNSMLEKSILISKILVLDEIRKDW